MLKNKQDQAGFIPMIILLLLLIGLVVWFSYKHVSDAHRAQSAVNKINTLRQNESR